MRKRLSFSECAPTLKVLDSIPRLPKGLRKQRGSGMAGKFELYEDKSGGFRFRLKAGNGEVIATSQGYKTKKSAMNGIDSVRRNADAQVVEVPKAE